VFTGCDFPTPALTGSTAGGHAFSGGDDKAQPVVPLRRDMAGPTNRHPRLHRHYRIPRPFGHRSTPPPHPSSGRQPPIPSAACTGEPRPNLTRSCPQSPSPPPTHARQHLHPQAAPPRMAAGRTPASCSGPTHTGEEVDTASNAPTAAPTLARLGRATHRDVGGRAIGPSLLSQCLLRSPCQHALPRRSGDGQARPQRPSTVAPVRPTYQSTVR
jgi:hypothetical protein